LRCLSKFFRRSFCIFDNSRAIIMLRSGHRRRATERGTDARGRRVEIKKAKRKRRKIMSKKSNRINVPEAREAMDKFKMEAASEVDVPGTS